MKMEIHAKNVKKTVIDSEGNRLYTSRKDSLSYTQASSLLFMTKTVKGKEPTFATTSLYYQNLYHPHFHSLWPQLTG